MSTHLAVGKQYDDGNSLWNHHPDRSSPAGDLYDRGIQTRKRTEHDRPGNEGSRTKQRDLLYYPVTPDHQSYLLLVPSLGRYFPWLRLSVVGSAAYETMVANMAAEALGLESITVPDIPADAHCFVCLFIITIPNSHDNIFNVFS